MKTFYSILALIFTVSTLSAQTILWDKSYGGPNIDDASSIVATPDGGYLIGGQSYSDISFEKSQNNKGGNDYWLIKIDTQGNKQWDKSFSGIGPWGDDLRVILPLSDGGYLLAGSSEGKIGYEKSEDSRGNWIDYWIIKLDASGNQLWDKTIGGPAVDGLGDVVETDDGGFLLGGHSFGQDLGNGYEKTAVPHNYSEDYWIVKIDANGDKIWDKIYGGEKYESCTKIIKTHDGNYLLAGSSNSAASYEKSEESRGNYDFWLVKIDPDGNQIWDKTIGGNDGDYLRKAILTPDGGFLLGGGSSSDTGFEKSQNNKGGNDYWVVKTDLHGNVEWDRTYGGSGYESLGDLLMTSDQHLVLIGTSSSPVSFQKSEESRGEGDFWILKTDLQGNIIWDKTIGGSKWDVAKDAQLSPQNELLILGNSKSPIGFDKTGFNRGTADFWLVKLDAAKTEKPKALVDIRDFVATCKPCWPWEIWWDFEYRFWDERYGLRRAVYRQAFTGDHQDEVFWQDEETLAIQLNENGLDPGSYQLQIRALLEDGTTTEWTAPESFEVGGTRIKVFPNPVQDILNIHYQTKVAEEVQLTLIDRYGRTLLRQEHYARRGTNEWKVSVPATRVRQNPLTLQLVCPSQRKQSWQLIRE